MGLTKNFLQYPKNIIWYIRNSQKCADYDGTIQNPKSDCKFVILQKIDMRPFWATFEPGKTLQSAIVVNWNRIVPSESYC